MSDYFLKKRKLWASDRDPTWRYKSLDATTKNDMIGTLFYLLYYCTGCVVDDISGTKSYFITFYDCHLRQIWYKKLFYYILWLSSATNILHFFINANNKKNNKKHTTPSSGSGQVIRQDRSLCNGRPYNSHGHYRGGGRTRLKPF